MNTGKRWPKSSWQFIRLGSKQFPFCHQWKKRMQLSRIVRVTFFIYGLLIFRWSKKIKYFYFKKTNAYSSRKITSFCEKSLIWPFSNFTSNLLQPPSARNSKNISAKLCFSKFRKKWNNDRYSPIPIEKRGPMWYNTIVASNVFVCTRCATLMRQEQLKAECNPRFCRSF